MKADIIILNSKDRKHIRQALTEQFGIESIPSDIVYFCLNKKERVYVCNKELFDLEFHLLRVNAFGLYFGTFMPDGFRLSIEGAQIIKPSANKNIYEITKNQRNQYLKGEDLECLKKEFQNQYVLIKFQNDFLGVGKVKNNNIKSYHPKSRRMKKIFNQDEVNNELKTCNSC